MQSWKRDGEIFLKCTTYIVYYLFDFDQKIRSGFAWLGPIWYKEKKSKAKTVQYLSD